jgi:hypothetical protein
VDTVDQFGDDPFFGTSCTLSGLEPDTAYYIKVTAVNEHAEEGYHSNNPFFVKTMRSNINDCDSLYSWGYNARNETGLPDDLIDQHSLDYVNGAMCKPVRNPMFNNLTYQVAPGNVSTLFLCANIENKETFLVTCGVCFAPNEGCDDKDLNELTADEVQTMMQEVPSIPFMVNFDMPVVQVMCGDLFQGLLTAHG